MYFDKAKMKINMDNVGRVGKDGSKKLLGQAIRIIIKLFITRNINTLIQDNVLNILKHNSFITDMKKLGWLGKEHLETQFCTEERMTN